ncbi:hypothetical protein CI238_12910 [Colletotrichum incanum]|uniref:Uncharacterized protein n=1 Tax=Colletotrichum incanum TaxID=1573173 RepID=A0A166QHI5_COLIC|nr:hypothetical protein CI238_12910 [Colletotrichum incanum]
MSCQSSTSFDVVSDWVSSMSPPTGSPRCSAIPPEEKHTIRDCRHETALSMRGLARTLRPALSSGGQANRIRPHITNSDEHCQPSAGAHQTARVAFYNKKRQPGRPARTARAEIKHSASDYNYNGCAIGDADETTEWEDSIEASETLVEHLQFVRRVDLDGTAAGCSLITIMLEPSGLCTKDEDAAAGAVQVEGSST